MTSTSKAPASRTDGRLNRSTRTRAAIVEAFIELIRAGNMSPTSEEVAERAQVGLRTVFRHFEDMESLYREVNRIILSSIEQEFEFAPLQGDLETRLRGLMERRGALFTRIQPFVMSTLARRWRSPFLQRTYKTFAELQHTYLLDSLPEVKDLDLPLQRAVEQLASFDTWNRMRDTQGLSQKAAEDVQVEAILALLATS